MNKKINFIFCDTCKKKITKGIVPLGFYDTTRINGFIKGYRR